ncbi:MAG: CTP-dependent riboflavin kinase [Nitrosopumilus sp. B06]|nr:MAG: CTP-dependent riboflavin kinase [Nitrosopumilus sp. D6]RNJ79440.1 MAG: CTP-dependent riboflavin kinase [Nitrosopumilus sp. B06]
MTELKIQHILTLSYLLSKGARRNFVPMSTMSLGRGLQKSQQAASRHLLDLEQGGFVERMVTGRTTSVRITARGYKEISRLYSALQKNLEPSPRVRLEGTLVSGMGEGAYYMALDGYTCQFRSKIGYVPFPGTLNVRLDKREHREAVRQFEGLPGTRIEGFSDGKRTYGWVKCFDAKINDIACHLIILERTHHDDSIVELISGVCLRNAATLDDGSKIVMTVSADP